MNRNLEADTVEIKPDDILNDAAVGRRSGRLEAPSQERTRRPCATATRPTCCSQPLRSSCRRSSARCRPPSRWSDSDSSQDAGYGRSPRWHPAELDEWDVIPKAGGFLHSHRQAAEPDNIAVTYLCSEGESYTYNVDPYSVQVERHGVRATAKSIREWVRCAWDRRRAADRRGVHLQGQQRNLASRSAATLLGRCVACLQGS